MRISDWSSDVCSSDFWQHTTLLGHRKRGTGVLNNELYVGVYVWNRQKFKTRPVNLDEMAELGERCSRPRVDRPHEPSEPPPEARRVGHGCGSKCRARWYPR